jgi:hypothetical protein
VTNAAAVLDSGKATDIAIKIAQGTATEVEKQALRAYIESGGKSKE